MPIFLSIISNIFVFYTMCPPSTKLESKHNFPLKENLITLKIPVRSYFEWDTKKLRSGVFAGLQGRDGKSILKKILVFTNENLNSNKTSIATVQIKKKEAGTIQKELKENSFLFLTIASQNEVKHVQGIQEIFF